MLNRARWSDAGVSPVVAVILMVAITVILSAVIGTFVLDLGQQTVGDSPQQDIGVSTNYANGQYTATIITGSADEVKILVNGTEVKNLTSPSAGDSLTVNVSTDSTVTILSVTGDSKTVTVTQTISSDSTVGPSVTAPTDKLVAHYLFDSGSGSTAVDSVGSANGTLYGNASWVAGKSEYAVDFDDEGSDEVRVGDVTFAETSPITVAGWVKIQNTSNHGAFIAKKGGGHPDTFTLVMASATSPPSVMAKIWNSSGSKASVSHPINESVWTHVAFTYDDSTLRLYVNGSEVDNTTIPGPIRDSGDLLRFGSDEAGNTPNATVEDARFYNKSLNDSEIQDLYDATK